MKKLMPTEFNVVVELDPLEEKTAGGIILPPSTQDRDELAADEGTLSAVSEHAFTYAEWPEGARKPQVGDRVLFKRYNGVLLKGENGEPSLRIVKDQDILCVVEPEGVTLPVAAGWPMTSEDDFEAMADALANGRIKVRGQPVDLSDYVDLPPKKTANA